MSEVLSQNEIDSLLSALSSGEIEAENVTPAEEEKKVKLYDFNNPNKFSKEHLRTLELIYENYSRIISTYLSAQIRKSVKIKIETMQQFTYEEFIRNIPNPTVLTIFRLFPLEGNLLFETNPDYVYQVLDILLGGTGDKKFKSKELTDIEKNIITRMNEGLIANMKLAWEDVLEVESEVVGVETNPALNQTLAPNESVALITFSVDLGKNHTFINLCIPFLSVEKILDKLDVQYWFRGRDEADKLESKTKIKERLNTVNVELTGVLGDSSINVQDFLSLKTGDVLTLNKKSTEPVKVKIMDKTYFYGKPGIIGKSRGIQVLDIIDKDVEENE
ncbi:flagellar motor switch protein FliM [Oceanirhabdus sp. W0125-5]|uniref:flagellar motor switch protein FliM n=1 Tax=Oceanirhabdus sp. W0125-5 TaxID=2999116 RepID=UPI0022F33383|nr:flagellar motor switch protein FliM [Oceanirhabdus sp. W0125-5]WBW95476.1 flagellar motor switch protein FliM [Oceanirhabdus sp. W0125-5]